MGGASSGAPPLPTRQSELSTKGFKNHGGCVFRQLEVELDAATHYKSPSPSPPAVTSPAESSGTRSHASSSSPRPSGSHTSSPSPRLIPSGSRSGSASSELVPSGSHAGSASPRLGQSGGEAGGGEGVEPVAAGDGVVECEWGGMKYSVGEVVYIRPR